MKALAIFALMALTAPTKGLAASYLLLPIADARVINFPGYQTGNFGVDILSVYTESSAVNTQRTFIKFDLSGITVAANETVQSAMLTLIASTGFGDNHTSQPMEIYRVVSPWTESGLSWTNRDSSHAWTNSGGDFIGIGGQPYAISIQSPTNGGAVTWDVTALIQEWVTHAAANNGLLLKSRSGNRLTFYQRESASPSLRPSLTVVTGLSPIQVSRNAGKISLWWTGAGSILQEKTNLNPAIAWSDSGRIVTQSGGSNSVTIAAPAGNNFFRLRSGP
ncbi:MAG TPA: DNRLRE domain-containing protein [Verrucomicrobiae bacterium]